MADRKYSTYICTLSAAKKWFTRWAENRRSIINLMSKKTELEAGLTQAMLDKNVVSRNTLRLVLSAVKEAEILKKSELEDAEIIGILQKQQKSRQESLDEAEKVGRNDLADEAKSELTVLENFLPAAMDETELITLIEDAIHESKASSPADMGNVMKILIPLVKGRADGGVISKLVRERLQG